jgi:hypothetical protein
MDWLESSTRTRGWYALIDLVDPGSPATWLLPDADLDLTFAFVAAD